MMLPHAHFFLPNHIVRNDTRSVGKGGHDGGRDSNGSVFQGPDSG